jgi:large subunit ribosomal protein L6
MKVEKLETKLPIPEGVTFAYNNGICKVSGPKGDVEKKLFHPGMEIISQDGQVEISYKKATKRETKVMFTYQAHIKNMVEGVQNGCKYELKICSGHFPMNVAVSGDKFIVKNFIGEKVPRVVIIKNGVSVKVNGDSVVVEHQSKEFAAQTAADIEKLTKRTGFDTRIFQDGIYIVNKNGKQM